MNKYLEKIARNLQGFPITENIWLPIAAPLAGAIIGGVLGKGNGVAIGAGGMIGYYAPSLLLNTRDLIKAVNS